MLPLCFWNGKSQGSIGQTSPLAGCFGLEKARAISARRAGDRSGHLDMDPRPRTDALSGRREPGSGAVSVVRIPRSRSRGSSRSTGRSCRFRSSVLFRLSWSLSGQATKRPGNHRIESEGAKPQVSHPIAIILECFELQVFTSGIPRMIWGVEIDLDRHMVGRGELLRAAGNPRPTRMTRLRPHRPLCARWSGTQGLIECFQSRWHWHPKMSCRWGSIETPKLGATGAIYSETTVHRAFPIPFPLEPGLYNALQFSVFSFLFPFTAHL